ncbi:MAG: class I SAM-dependent methyltransferase [Bryobacteraceae bacterium]
MVLSPPAAYRLWAPSYDTDLNPLLALEERMVRHLLPHVHSRKVLDVGCGTGRSMARYGARGALAFGLDSCPEMLAEARKKPGLGISLVVAEASHLPFADDVADVTLCSFSLSYFPDLHQSVNELARVTKPDGQIVISDLHPLAAASGWTRSFRVGSEKYDIDHSCHDDRELNSAFQNAGLQVVTQVESGFDEPERSLFAAAGKAHVYPALIGRPAVRVIVCHKV